MGIKLSYFGPLVPVIVIVMLIFILCYLIHGKYKTTIRIKEIPYSTIFYIDLQKVKLNLKIESMVYNFLILLCTLELIAVVLTDITEIEGILCTLNNLKTKTKTENCVIFTGSNNSKFHPITPNFNRISDITNDLIDIVTSTILSVSCLFLIVLRRAYLNLPYKHWIKGYTLWIIVKIILQIIISFLHPISYLIMSILIYPIENIETVVYISCCRSFYRLLKGRTFEAKWHSTRSDYIAKRRISTQFYYAQIYTIFLFSIIGLVYLLCLIEAFFIILYQYTDYFNQISIRLFHKDILTSKVQSSIHYIIHYNSIIIGISGVFLFLTMFLGYFLVCIGIIIKFIRRKRKYKHVNDWITKPLMERYRATLDTPFRRSGQRPPFIQAFRSGPVY